MTGPLVSQSPTVNVTESKQPEIQSDLNSLKKDGADLKKKIEDQAKQPAMQPGSTMKVSTKQAQMMATQNARNQVKPVVEQTKKVEAELQKLADDYKGGCAVPGVAPKSNMCFVMGTLLALANGSRVPIEQVRLGQRVSTWKDSELGYRELFTNLDTLIDPTQYRAIWFHLEDEFGNRVEFGMLKPLTWLWQENVSQVGDRAAFNLPEMGVVGLAQVMAIEPCPPIEAGPGRIVMSVFRHYRAAIWRLIVDNDVIEGTELHPFWSLDRLAWVALRHLRTGENLSGGNGPVSTRNIEDTGRIEPVFNLEVDADHCYRVGEQGLLVHNVSSGPLTAEQCKEVGGQKKKTITITGKGPVRTYTFEFDQCRTDKASGRLYALTEDSEEDRQPGQQTKMLDLFFGSTAARGSFDAGHLIANDLGGPGSLENLVPMRKKFNENKSWKQMDQWLYKCAQKLIIDMVVEVGYDTDRCAPERDVPLFFTVSLTFKYKNGKPVGTDSHVFQNRNNASVWKKKFDPCPGD